MTAVEESNVRSTSQLVSDAVRQFRSQVPDCIASGLVDMSTGMLLAADTLDDHPSEVLDLLAAATFDLFQGRNVVMIEDIFKAAAACRMPGTTSRRSWCTTTTWCTSSYAAPATRTPSRWWYAAESRTPGAKTGPTKARFGAACWP
ncbi:hypothetical protein ACIA5C_46705 [Actinoplanes sp. NPDC051343]|uniref:hypothetical protein n=1 Tax=Actinoplanes sp. NPDC051343 TaxID=3363906 RepID=UPI0037A08A56